MPDVPPVVMELGGKRYLKLTGGPRILAVYRVRNDGMLKRLRRWPSELDREQS
jgi:hypothetical protein